MGSYAHLYRAGYPVYTTKSSVDPKVTTLFRERDKRVYERTISDRSPLSWGKIDEDETEVAYEYTATVAQIKQRLDVLGHSLAMAEQAFIQGIQSTQDEHIRADKLFPVKDEKWQILRSRERELLSRTQFRDWLGAYAHIQQHQLTARKITVYDLPPKDTFLIRYILGKIQDRNFFPFGNERLFIRAFIEECPNDAPVTQDITDLVEGGYYAPNEAVWETAMEELISDYPTNAPIVVLTEGSSDAELLARSLALLYPHLVGYYTFTDFGRANAPGGAAALVATIKAFAGAGIANRTIALFDNDTAAEAAIRGLARTLLPNSIAVLRYPELEMARHYPTIGPSGKDILDVNGFAGSLELYFGEDVLDAMPGGRPPVQWRGFDQSIGRYQGEILHKGDLQDAFRHKLTQCEANSRQIMEGDWMPMRLLLSQLFGAFHFNRA